MDPIEQTLVATQNLLCALEQDNSLLKDQHFMNKLTFLRSKHKETTDMLLQQTQYPPRSHISGATYHKSPGCNHFWSEIPVKFKVPENSRIELHGEEEEFGAVGRISFSKPVVQDAADVIRNLRTYRRALRQQHSTAVSSKPQDPDEESSEGPSSYQPRPSSFRSSRFRHRFKKAETTDEKQEVGKTNSVSTADLRLQLEPEDKVESRNLGVKSVSVQDLRVKGTMKKEDERPTSAQVTVPKPFAFMQRRYKGNTYARKFLEKMLDEKEKEEKAKLEEEESSHKPFKAHPVPRTTYKADNPRVEDKRHVDAIRKRLQTNLRLQTTLVRSKSMGDVVFNQVKPVPASTYVAPDLYSYRRGRDTNKRAVQLLAEAHTPPGLKEHSVRTNVAFHLRHQHCREESPVRKDRRQSVPDFRRLHREFNEKLQRVYSSKPPTVPVPFKLSENSTRHKHDSPSPPRLTNSRRPSPSLEPVFPVQETLSSLLRAEAIRNRLDNETAEKERKFHADAEHEAEIDLQRSRLRRSISRKSEKDIDKMVEERRQAMKETTREYEHELREMKKRILSRPLVMEQQSTSAQQHAIERKFKEALSGAKESKLATVNFGKIEDIDVKTLIVPLRRGSGESGVTYSVKSKKSSNSSSKSSEKDEYKLDFESDEDRPSRTSKSSGSSSSSKSSESSSKQRSSKPSSSS